jgi:hypothetical protein
MKTKISKFDPAVDKRILVAVSGTIWTAVGILLCTRAVNWLSDAANQKALWPGIAGVLLALVIHHFGFVKLANKNINRIMAKKGKVCIFGFQPWKSYFIILIMISMGIILRQSSIPKTYLSIIYMGFGGAMLLSSIRYHRIFFKLL